MYGNIRKNSASFLAIRCLFELANECEKEHPKIANIIRRDMYCDDLLTSCQEYNSITVYICKTISKVLFSGGFTLRKWNSNYPDTLKGVHQANISNNILEFGPNENSKTLGLLYNSYSDEFLYTIHEFFNTNIVITKRIVLSFISTIFDPLGLLTPCTTYAKIFIQQLWSLHISWDSPLPKELASQWIKYTNEMSAINELRIHRQVHHQQP